jgi:hypothetical protein
MSESRLQEQGSGKANKGKHAARAPNGGTCSSGVEGRRRRRLGATSRLSGSAADALGGILAVGTGTSRCSTGTASGAGAVIVRARASGRSRSDTSVGRTFAVGASASRLGRGATGIVSSTLATRAGASARAGANGLRSSSTASVLGCSLAVGARASRPSRSATSAVLCTLAGGDRAGAVVNGRHTRRAGLNMAMHNCGGRVESHTASRHREHNVFCANTSIKFRGNTSHGRGRGDGDDLALTLALARRRVQRGPHCRSEA